MAQPKSGQATAWVATPSSTAFAIFSKEPPGVQEVATGAVVPRIGGLLDGRAAAEAQSLHMDGPWGSTDLRGTASLVDGP